MGSLLYITYSRQLLRWLLYAAYPGIIGWSGIMDKYLSKEHLKLSTEQFFKFRTCTGILLKMARALNKKAFVSTILDDFVRQVPVIVKYDRSAAAFVNIDDQATRNYVLNTFPCIYDLVSLSSSFQGIKA